MALFPAVGSKQTHVRVGWWLVISFLLIGITLHLIPFYFMLITSFKSGIETASIPPTLWPQQPTLQAWVVAFTVVDKGLTGMNTDASLVTYLWNSIFMTGMTILLSTPITALAAYATSKLLRGPLARWIFLFFIGTMLLPGSVTLVSSYMLVNHFPFPFINVPVLPSGELYPHFVLIDTPWAIIIPAIFNVGGYFYFKAFFDTIPDSVIQAARVDGGSEFNIFRRIVLPMSIPVFAIVIPGQFYAIWDAYLWPSLVITSGAKQPLSVAINTIINQFMSLGATNATEITQVATKGNEMARSGLTWNGIMVLGILQSIPGFLFFVLSFRFLLSGIRIRGLK